MLVRFTAEPEKVRDYLLNGDHPQNGGKAAFFDAFGYNRENWQALALALAADASTDDVVVHLAETSHGVKFVVDRLIQSPDGRNPWIRTVWLSDGASSDWRLVTAYPAQPRT